MVRQVMQKQVRLFLNQIKREICSKGSKRVRTKESDGVKERNRKIESG